jgi:hypothetical protein
MGGSIVKNRTALFVLASSIALMAVHTSAQTKNATISSAPAPVANVYVQTSPGVMVYNAAANGTLTVVKGSPFKGHWSDGRH